MNNKTLTIIFFLTSSSLLAKNDYTWSSDLRRAHAFSYNIINDAPINALIKQDGEETLFWSIQKQTKSIV